MLKCSLFLTKRLSQPNSHKEIEPHKEVLGRVLEGFGNDIFVGGVSSWQRWGWMSLYTHSTKTSRCELASENRTLRFPKSDTPVLAELAVGIQTRLSSDKSDGHRTCPIKGLPSSLESDELVRDIGLFRSLAKPDPPVSETGHSGFSGSVRC